MGQRYFKPCVVISGQSGDWLSFMVFLTDEHAQYQNSLYCRVAVLCCRNVVCEVHSCSQEVGLRFRDSKVDYESRG